MPTTTNFGWTTPADTDLVKDGASAIRTLGNGIDTSLVDLKGGTTGQVLSKASNTDMDFTWVAQDDSNAIQNALLTTTGDTIYASGASTPARLGIGTAGQVLTVNSGATAPEWKTSSSFQPTLTAQQSGRYIRQNSTVALTSLTLTEDTTYYFPIFLPAYALDRISIRTGGSHSGTSTVRLGLYNADISTGKPGTVYLDAGTVSATAINTNYEITISNTPPAGYYYFALNVQALTGTADFSSYSNSATERPIISFYQPTFASMNGQSVLNGYTESGITGAFATAGTLTVYTSGIINMAVRIA
jgi:hypothetical protein